MAKKTPSGSSREIFVFGSNLVGVHGAGSARVAYDRHGATWGNGMGISGGSYAIPTKMSPKVNGSLPLDSIEVHVQVFTEFAAAHPELFFRCVAVGCGKAGYRPAQIAPLFRAAHKLPNVELPFEFAFILDKEKP